MRIKLYILVFIFWNVFVTGLCAQGISFTDKLVQAALKRTQQQVVYDGRYFTIPYPWGDVPAHVGVCTDVIIRTYRALGIDLQKRVHEDMKSNFEQYPKTWGLKKPDPNIDHRRVPNLQVFFTRKGQALPISSKGSDYKPGDMVTWNLSNQRILPHIGIVTDLKSADNERPLIVHNIGRGPELEDILFDFKITGHYRYVEK